MPLCGLALEGQAPVFKRVNRMGMSYPALIMGVAFCGLVFLDVISASSAKCDVSVVHELQVFAHFYPQYLHGRPSVPSCQHVDVYRICSHVSFIHEA